MSALCEGVPTPSPTLLALHALCARVAHMSGAAEHFGGPEQDASGSGSSVTAGPVLQAFFEAAVVSYFIYLVIVKVLSGLPRIRRARVPQQVLA